MLTPSGACRTLWRNGEADFAAAVADAAVDGGATFPQPLPPDVQGEMLLCCRRRRRRRRRRRPPPSLDPPSMTTGVTAEVPRTPPASEPSSSLLEARPARAGGLLRGEAPRRARPVQLRGRLSGREGSRRRTAAATKEAAIGSSSSGGGSSSGSSSSGAGGSLAEKMERDVRRRASFCASRRSTTRTRPSARGASASSLRANGWAACAARRCSRWSFRQSSRRQIR